MDAEGCSYSSVRTIGVQPTRSHSSQPLFVCNPRCRVLSARFRRVVCVNTLAAESPRLLGSVLSAEEVRNRFQPTLRTHEATGSQSLRLKMNTTGRAAVRIWSPMGTQISAPPSWSQCSAKCRIRLKGFWLMAKEIGVVAECTDIQLDTAEAECPF